MNPESTPDTARCADRRAAAARAAGELALLAVLVFLAAWPWEIFQRIPGGPTLVFAASTGLLAFGMVRAVVAQRPRAWFPARLALPIALLALACLQSALHSAAPGATRALLAQYVWYLLLFCAAAPLFSRSGDALLAWRVFAVSAGLVGAYAVCCAAGWLTPALAGTHEYFGRRLTEDVRVGAFVRIAATTPDYNQAILPMLLALPFLLVWAATPNARRAGRVAAALLALLVVAGVVVSFSRSGLLAVAGVAMGGMAWFAWERGRGASAGSGFAAGTPRIRRRLWMVAGVAVVLIGLAAVLVAGGYAEMLARRALRGINAPDPSYRSRLYVFGLAFKLLPKYALLGCGLGASGTVLGAAAEPGKWFGTAIHSMPLLLWFETGILGLAGYLWLWWRAARRVWTGLACSPRADRRRLGMAALGALAVLFWMLAVQPFQALSLFPVFAALAIGPAAGEDTAEAPSSTRSRAWRMARAGALAAVAGLVAVNIGLYSRVVKQVAAYADALEQGLGHERRGDWDAARIAYEGAETCAGNPLFPALDPPRPGAPYYENACRAVDLEFVFMRLPGRGGPSLLPREVSGFGAARCLWNAGQAEEAMQRLSRSGLPLFWPEAAYAFGEMCWRQGCLSDAMNQWAGAAEQNAKRGPWPPLEYPQEVAPSLDDLHRMLDAEARALAASDRPADQARRAMLLLRLGRRDEAAALTTAAPADAPEFATLRDAFADRGQKSCP